MTILNNIQYNLQYNYQIAHNIFIYFTHLLKYLCSTMSQVLGMPQLKKQTWHLPLRSLSSPGEDRYITKDSELCLIPALHSILSLKVENILITSRFYSVFLEYMVKFLFYQEISSGLYGLMTPKILFSHVLESPHILNL